MKQLIDQFNNDQTLAVVSPYPRRGEVYSKGTTGVASYSKNVIKELSRTVVVLCDRNQHTEVYQEDNALVVPSYRKNSVLMWFEIYRQLRKFNRIKTVLVHFDFSMYGSFVTTGLIVIFALFLKLLGYKVSVVAHHVILDVSKLSGHLGLTNSLVDQVKAAVYNLVFRLFYLTLGVAVHNIIVLEDVLKERLSKLVNRKKIVTIPHAVDTSLESVSKSQARKALGIKPSEQVVLFFGFVNWFKGADFFVETFQNITKLLGKNARFIIAGGKSPTLSGKTYYDEYYQSVVNTIDNSKRVEITGYVPQEKISLYFSAADLVVFPYRDLMCASGVMSLTFSYKKPFIVSDELSAMFDAADFREAFKKVDLDKRDVTFALSHTDFLNQTTNVLADGVKPKLVELTKLMRDSRSFQKTATLYEEALFATQPVVSTSLALETMAASKNKISFDDAAQGFVSQNNI